MAQAQGFEKAAVIPAFPHFFRCPEGGEELFRRLQGATIIRIGAPDLTGLEGGGLVIDYVDAGDSVTRRVVFEFNELGLWTAWEGVIPMLGTVAG